MIIICPSLVTLLKQQIFAKDHSLGFHLCRVTVETNVHKLNLVLLQVLKGFYDAVHPGSLLLMGSDRLEV